MLIPRVLQLLRMLRPLHRFAIPSLLLMMLFIGCSKPAGLSERHVATRYMAEHLQKTLHPGKVLVLSNPFAQLPGRPANVYKFEEAGLAGLKDGFKQVPIAIAAPELKPEVRDNPASVPIDPKSATPLSFLITAQAFDQCVQAHADCDLVVSLIGLPVDLAHFQAWNRGGKPAFALLLPDLRMIGNLEAVRKAFISGKIAAAVLRKPGAPAEDSDAPVKFEDRFLLVSAANVDEAIARYPQAFAY